MDKIWLKIKGIQLCDFHLDGNRPGAAWATVKVGDSFVIKGYYFTLEKNGDICQNNAMSRMRFLDAPLLHKNEEKPAPLLDHILFKAIYDEYLAGDKRAELLAFLRGENGLKEFPFLAPKEWQGKSLMIPVDYIALRSPCSSMLSDGSVYANIFLGDHLVFWEQLIFNCKTMRYAGSGSDRDQRDTIYDKEAIGVINQILHRRNVRRFIRDISEQRTLTFSDTVFFDKTVDYDAEMITGIKGKVPQPVEFQ